MIGEQLAPTLTLALAAAGLGVLLALVIAVATAGDRRPWLRRVSSGAELLLVSTPPFLIGHPAAQRAVLPVRHCSRSPATRASPRWCCPPSPWRCPSPVCWPRCCATASTGRCDEPFVLTARARGVRNGRCCCATRCGTPLLPAVTLAGWLFGILLGGAVIVEQVFGRPGLGQVTLTRGDHRKDMPVVLAVVTLSAAVYVAVNTIADLAYLLVDPRLRRS